MENKVLDSNSSIEIWSSINGYEGLYEVSSFGRVRSIKKGREYILKQYITKQGYMNTILWKGNKMKNFRTHRLVAASFIPNYKNMPYVNHKDENRTNNNYLNLEWCTPKYNSNYGTSRKKCSINNGCNRPVLQLDFEGNVINEFYNISYAAKHTGVSQVLIAQCCRCEKVRGGDYLWCYKDNTVIIPSLVKKRTGVYYKIKGHGYLRANKLAEIMGISRSTLYTARNRGTINKLLKKYGLCIDNV